MAQTKICTVCGENKPVVEFKCKKCKYCTYQIKKNRINSIPRAYLSTLVSNARNHSKKNDKKICVLLVDDIVKLLESQNSLCYYTQLPMNLKICSDYQCSLERKDPSKGYEYENVALIIAEFQGACQWSIEKYNIFAELIFIKHSRQIICWNPVITYSRSRGYKDANYQ